MQNPTKIKNANGASSLKDFKKENAAGVMEILFQKFQPLVPKIGELVEGTVLEIRSPYLFIDLGEFGTGIVFGREFYDSREIIKNLRKGSKVVVKVLNLESEDNNSGYVEISLKEAGREVVWNNVQKSKEEGKILNLPVVEVNKGGVILEWEGIQGFLPTSQLKAAHYPRVEGGDKDKIVEELKKLINKTISVVIIDVNQKEGKLIFSEKDADRDSSEIISKYKIGDVFDGEITGVMDFGVFVKIDNNFEGLVHISELDWTLVEKPADLFSVGDKVKVKVIGIENGKISLSIKALKPDPWEEIKNKYHLGDAVSGVVFKFNKYGAYINIEEGISGLAHISEFGTIDKMKEQLEIGKSYLFKITVFSLENHRLAFSLVKEDQG